MIYYCLCIFGLYSAIHMLLLLLLLMHKDTLFQTQCGNNQLVFKTAAVTVSDTWHDNSAQPVTHLI